jgi:predicted alpha/beta hydrolase family esterase
VSSKRQVLFIQGGGSGVHDEWDNKLVASLRRELGPRYELRYPHMPSEGDPSYEAWKPTLHKELGMLESGAILVAHSVGGTVVVRILAETSPPPLGAIVLIAPAFVGDGGWPNDEQQSSAELTARLPKDVPIHLFHGLEDRVVPPSHADLYARAIPHAHVHRMPGRDHQLNDDLREVARTIESLEARV